MDSDIISLGETHLMFEESVDIDGYSGFFLGYGKGKGIAVYSKINFCTEPLMFDSENQSAIQVKTLDFVLINL